MQTRAKHLSGSRRFRMEAAKNDRREKRAFSFLDMNQRQEKPRCFGLTEIRGPHYSPMGKRYLEDVLETMGDYVDSLKFAGGSFSLMPRGALRDIIETAHRFNVQVSTGGFIERVLSKSAKLIDRYVAECADVGFDIIEISSGFITLPIADWLALVKKVRNAGLKAKPEIGIQFGAGGASEAAALEAVGTASPQLAIERAKRFLDAGVQVIMIESEGITESVNSWRAEVPAQFANALGLEHLTFEAAEPKVFSWYIQNFGQEVNLFVDHSQIVQLECLRRGIWGTSDLWGRVVTFKE